MPHKEAAYALADVVDPCVTIAANLLVLRR